MFDGALRVHCSEGLGNRVAALANGLSRAEEVVFPWVVNEHVPATWEDVFPQGVEGVTFISAASAMPPTEWDGMSCERWDAAGDRRQADMAYGRIMAAMRGTVADGCEVAIAARFHRTPGGDARRLAILAAYNAPEDGAVFVFADSRRVQIWEVLDALDVTFALPRSSMLATDLDRDRAGLLRYIGDWKRLLEARLIVAIDGPSSALHPARAAGIEIIYVPAVRVQG